MTLPRDLERRLGDDLVALLRERPDALVAARCVSSRPERSDGAAFPEPIACRGSALFTPWMDETPVSSIEPLDDTLVERTGEILVGLHRLPVPEWRRLGIRTPADLFAPLSRDLSVIADAGLLESRR